MQLNFFAKLTSRHASRSLLHTLTPVMVAPSKIGIIPDTATLQEYARNLLRSVHPGNFADGVQIVWNPRMRTTAGMAYPTKALITLNPKMVEFGPDEVDRTLRHELAHLLAHQRAGRRKIAMHGAEWKQACADLGLAGERRCHNLPLPRREMQRRYLYRCPNCAVEVPRVKPLRRKSACLVCCRAHAHGRYDERFRFIKLIVP